MKKLVLTYSERDQHGDVRKCDRFVVELDAQGELSIVKEGRPLVTRGPSVRLGMGELSAEISA